MIIIHFFYFISPYSPLQLKGFGHGWPSGFTTGTQCGKDTASPRTNSCMEIFPTKFSSCFYSLLQEANMHYVENCGNYGPPTKGTIMYIVREPDIISNLPHFVKKNRCSTLWGHSKSVTDKNEKVWHNIGGRGSKDCHFKQYCINSRIWKDL